MRSAAVLVALALAGCGSGGSAATPTPAPTAASTPAPSAAPTASANEPAPPELDVVAGKPVGGISQFLVNPGARVRFMVKTTQPGVVRVPGYGVRRRVAKSAVIAFTAKVGTARVKFAHRVVAKITVKG